ncbi:hypothetical protein RIF29_31887 [Crotalaria pallida]|uniref:Uncharacterized protein n=1 Tax=Crotalaria pallida TaxID=3830 RepID=A0AAN9EK24_CROPI
MPQDFTSIRNCPCCTRIQYTLLFFLFFNYTKLFFSLLYLLFIYVMSLAQSIVQPNKVCKDGNLTIQI